MSVRFQPDADTWRETGLLSSLESTRLQTLYLVSSICYLNIRMSRRNFEKSFGKHGSTMARSFRTTSCLRFLTWMLFAAKRCACKSLLLTLDMP